MHARIRRVVVLAPLSLAACLHSSSEPDSDTVVTTPELPSAAASADEASVTQVAQEPQRTQSPAGNEAPAPDVEREEASQAPMQAAPPGELTDSTVSGNLGLGARGRGPSGGGGGEGIGAVAIGSTSVSGRGYGAGRASAAPATTGVGHIVDVQGRDQFEHYGFNGWTRAADDALATFSIDVDTASYSLARRMLRSGRLPEPASVRVEEFVNSFGYRYEPPRDASVPFAVHLEAAPSRFGADRHLLRVGIQAERTHAADRQPANLVFLIDSSGSMSAADKLPLVKHALRTLLAGLGPDDTLSIVTYAGASQIVLPPTPVRNHEDIAVAIDSILAGGGTNGAEGIRTAYEVARSALVEGGTNRVIWCSDGDLNVGMTGDALLAFIEENGRNGVALTTLGFGTGNLNDRDLERFANRGDGNYHYIGDRNEALRVLSTELTGTIEVVARDVKIQVEFDPDVVSTYRLIGYENRNIADADFRNDAVDAGEIGNGHAVTALVELTLAPGAQADAELATVRVRYEMPDEEGEGREVAQTIAMRSVHTRFDDASPSFRLAAGVAEFAEVLRMAEFVEDEDLSAVADTIRAASGDGELDADELLTLVMTASGLSR